jgi:UDP-N-acetyl-D-glucosamine dehydrogenase
MTTDTTTPPLREKLADRTARIAVLGQGYVGLVVAMRASEAGFDVVGYEPDAPRAAALVAGDSYIEDVPDTVLQAALERGYRPTSDAAELAGFDVAVISVPTPLHEGLPDLSFIESAGALVGEHLTAGALVVLESTTYPGTTTELLGPLLEQGSGLVAGREFHLGYSPERIDPGNPDFGLTNTPKVVAGIDPESAAATVNPPARSTRATPEKTAASRCVTVTSAASASSTSRRRTRSPGSLRTSRSMTAEASTT